MTNKFDKKVEELESVEYNKAEARVIASRAKHLTYPITDITSPLMSLAIENGLEGDMEYYLDDVRAAQNKLESAIFRCEDVFADKEVALECELSDMADNEENFNDEWTRIRTMGISWRFSLRKL